VHHTPGLARSHGQLPIWVIALLDTCRLMGNYLESCMNMVSTGAGRYDWRSSVCSGVAQVGGPGLRPMIE